jgi:hypothetical protein
MQVVIRPTSERWFPSADAAVRFAISPPSRGIDYARVSTHDGGHGQVEARELRARVLACLALLPLGQRQALECRACWGSWSACARVAHVRREHVYSIVEEARSALAYRLRRQGLMAPTAGQGLAG